MAGKPAISERTYKLIKKGLERKERYVDIARHTHTSPATVCRVYYTETYKEYLKGRKKPHWWNHLFK